MNRNFSIRLLITGVGALLCSVLNGCATTAGSHRSVATDAVKADLGRFTELIVTLDSQQEIPALTASEKERIVNLIKHDIQTQAPQRFAAINPQSPGPQALKADVLIKEFEEGNAFARAMLAGLGQMHIHADVKLSDLQTNEVIATHDVEKTFAWGGIYGAATRIQDVEVGFAEAVAAAILEK
jgi:hypothetical protein